MHLVEPRDGVMEQLEPVPGVIEVLVWTLLPASRLSLRCRFPPMSPDRCAVGWWHTCVMTDASAITAAAAGTWKLGDLTVNRMGFGGMRLTGGAPFSDGPPSDRAQVMDVLRQSIELGVNHIDTAAFYFSPLRSANELINSALAPYPQSLVITTKVGPGRDPSGEWLPWATPQQLRGQVEQNLRQLGRDHLDVVNLRTFGPGSIAEHFGVLAQLSEAGLIRHLGVSNVDVGQLAEARSIASVVCVQNRFSLDSQRSDSAQVLQACKESDIAFVPFFAIAGKAREAQTAGEEHPKVQAIARAYDASAAQIRLAWTLHQGQNVLAIPGTGNPDHLRENIAAGALQLSCEDVASLDALYANED